MRPLNLLYHRVNTCDPDPWNLCVAPANFAEQMEVVSKLTPRPVVTFDDGYADNLHQALPILEKLDVAAQFFVVSGAVGSPVEMWWDALDLLFSPESQEYERAFDRIRHIRFPAQQIELNILFGARGLAREARPKNRMLNEAELCQLAASPLVEVGAHTITHPVLSLLTLKEQENEIKGSKDRLEKILGRPVRGFAYPNGMAADYTSETVAAVRRAGFAYAYSAFDHSRDDPFQRPRVMIRDWNGEQFAEVLQSAARS